jgi:hypothetical protein
MYVILDGHQTDAEQRPVKVIRHIAVNGAVIVQAKVAVDPFVRYVAP